MRPEEFIPFSEVKQTRWLGKVGASPSALLALSQAFPITQRPDSKSREGREGDEGNGACARERTGDAGALLDHVMQGGAMNKSTCHFASVVVI